MSDPQATEPTTSAEPAPVAEPVVAEPATTTAAEPVVAATTATTPVAPAAPAAAPAPVAAPAKKGRGVGIWSLVIGILVVIADVALLVFAAVALVGSAQVLLGAISSGDVSAVAGIAGFASIALLFVVSLFGGLVVAGLGALLGLIALITGRGRVIGFIGLLLSAAALTWRILVLTAGLNVGGLVGG